VLEGKTVFITGGARGLGLGIARACAEQGAKLALADKDVVALEEAVASLEGIAPVRGYELDVADRQHFLEVADQVEQELGPVHALFNNAGVIDSVSPSQMRGELWDWMVGVNLNGVYNGVQAFVPRMIARGEGGMLVNVSSMAGLVPAGSGFAYHATKFAVVGMTESLRGELAHHKISVSIVCPGQMATSIVRNTETLRPADAEPHTNRVRGILDSAHERLMSNGVDPDVAGRNVLEAALAGQPYIFTDGLFKDFLEMRHQAILECVPPADEAALAELKALAARRGA
jgi:NAD(P)-dependent dehydrogenase (short-subunit alcohol dehydrogenase family)